MPPVALAGGETRAAPRGAELVAAWAAAAVGAAAIVAALVGRRGVGGAAGLLTVLQPGLALSQSLQTEGSTVSAVCMPRGAPGFVDQVSAAPSQSVSPSIHP